MKQCYFIVFLLLFSFGLQAQQKNKSQMNKDYYSLWEKVEQFEKQDLPKSAKETTSQILNQAIADKNTQQSIKALICINKYDILIDADNNKEKLFTDLENLLKETKNTEDKALLHSMLGELYLKYYQDDNWTINNRTELADFVPEDMKEWSRNLFMDKIFYHLDEAVKDKAELLKSSSAKYNALIVKGKDSKEFYPTLYDFLMKRNIDFSYIRRYNEDYDALLKVKGTSIKEIGNLADKFVTLNLDITPKDYSLKFLDYYQQYMKSLIERNMAETLVMTEISKILSISSISYSFLNNDRLTLLLELQKKYEKLPVSIEIINAIVDYYSSGSYYRHNQNDDEDKTKAYEWCQKGIEMFPDYPRTAILRDKISGMENPQANINGSNTFYPATNEKNITLNYKNLNKVTLTIQKQNQAGEYKPYKTKEINLTPKTTYLTENKSIDLDINEIGSYKIDLDFDKKVERKSTPARFYISRLMTLCRIAGEKQYEFYVVDRMTGTPVNGATVHIIKKDNKTESVIKEIKTDSKGFAVYNSPVNLHTDYSLRDSYKYSISEGNDKPDYKNDFPYDYTFNSNRNTQQTEKAKISIFTDRSIYRPTQTVYFKAVAAQVESENNIFPITGKEYKVRLLDSNSQQVSEQTLKTNEFGSISGQFVIPQGRLTGSYQIETDNNRAYIQVEEYKRPTFEVKFDRLKGYYTFGDKVTIKGHAENFSGVKLQGANVNYNITRSSWWSWRNEGYLTQGDIVTQEDGSFEIEYTIPVNDSKNIPIWRNIFNFTVSATVTDMNGETQNGSFTFTVGSVSMILSCNIYPQMEREKINNIWIKASNLNGEETSTSGTYIISKIESDSVKTEVAKGEFNTTEQAALKESLKKLASGKYQIRLKAKDSNGRDIEDEKEFVLYSIDDKKPPIETNNWYIVKNRMFSKDKPAEIVLGVSPNTATVLYELIKGGKVFERQQIKISDENKVFTIPYKAEYEDEVYAVFTYVIDEKLYQQNERLSKLKEIKELNLKLEVFRDKLRPGQHEEWRLSVTDAKNNPLKSGAEVLASMYDTSLDKLRNTDGWYFNLYQRSYTSPLVFNRANYSENLYNSFYFGYTPLKVPNYIFDYLDWFGFSFSGRILLYNSGSYGANPDYRVRGRSTVNTESADMIEGLYGRAAGVEIAELQDEKSENKVISEAAPASEPVRFTPPGIIESDEDGATGSGQEVQIRRNFNETAFFYPQLKTNEKGETVISFTVPESNTTWKFRAIAHDKSFNSGKIEQLVVSRKELMVTPNLPRFMREGDRTSISTKVSNLSDNPISGKVRIEFFDPLTEKAVDLKVANSTQNFTLNKDASTSATWTFDVPSGIDMIGCRIIAESNTFSDGEQHAIAVLPNRMLVTESMPLNVNGVQTKQFTFDKLANNSSKSLSNYRLTLEYSSNPAWYAVQALPVLSNPQSENAVSWFASYYVNTLGAAITQQYPKVSAMINTWKKQGETAQSLSSKLTDNEELKAVLLEETPWVLEAKNETEQMQRLSLLFDLNNTRMLQDAATQKLQEMQNSDGGWSWFKGFSSNRSMTQYILYGYNSLIQVGAVQYPSEIKVMQMNALKFIDKGILNDYENLKKYMVNWQELSSVSTNQLEYLYVRSAYRDIPINQLTREAERFYTSVAERNWKNLNLYERSLLVIVSLRNGNKTLANQIMQSLRERTTTDEEKGMFWANNKSNVFMSLSGVSTHVFLMDAFRETGASNSEMNQLKLWLLKQKQTQLWESTHATIDAIYGLLSTGDNWFATEGNVDIKVGGKKVEPENKQSGTGYFKESWSKSEVSKPMAKVEVSNKEDIPSYGAIYWQYFEDLDKITDQNGNLNVQKSLFVEKASDKGKSLNSITESSPLKVGDKVTVRLTIRVDRDMSFVHIKDMRASCFEPLDVLSGNRWQNSLIYYQTTKDASTNFYFDHMPKGTYVLEYPVYVNRTGEYSNGITTIQCMYAPEFVSHTQGIRVNVKE